jgi:hypothetical protein
MNEIMYICVRVRVINASVNMYVHSMHSMHYIYMYVLQNDTETVTLCYIGDVTK